MIELDGTDIVLASRGIQALVGLLFKHITFIVSRPVKENCYMASAVMQLPFLR